jgi:hypothetical protein
LTVVTCRHRIARIAEKPANLKSVTICENLKRVTRIVFSMSLLHVVSFSILKSQCEITKVLLRDFIFQLCENAPQSSTDKKVSF